MKRLLFDILISPFGAVLMMFSAYFIVHGVMRDQGPPPLISTSLVEPAPVLAEIPKDAAARAKFKREKPEIVDALALINRMVNQAMRPMADKAQYGREDMWVMLPESMAGDCEDYVLSKIAFLTDAHFPVVANSRLRAVVVHRKGHKPDGHAILELRLPKGSIAFMDNNFDVLMTRRELVAQGYEFFDW